MSHRFVRCPHCKMPHEASERVCPNTGLRMPTESRAPAAGSRVAAPRTSMSEMPPPERPPEPLAFDPHRDRVPRKKKEPLATRDELIGETIGGRYMIKGVLGQGGMGTVYDAEHLSLSRQVAIKVLSPSQAKKRVAVKRFQQEARAAGAIGHPNICEVYDLGLLDDGSPYLVMEKLVGSTLADRIAKEGGLPFDDVIEIIVQVLSGLIAAHDKGIVHRDIKPENIFLAKRIGSAPIIKLLDFGVSKMMPEYQNGEESLDLTRTGMVMGTPYYMAPEQARGERALDGRVDVYACGVVMYEAIVGRRPFLAPNYNALLLSIINDTPRPIGEARPGTPPSLQAIVERAMTKNRDERYASALHFLRELQPNASEAGVLRLPPSPELEERRSAPGGPRVRQVAEDPEVAKRARITGPTETVIPLAAAPPPPPPPLAENDSSTRFDIRLHNPEVTGATPPEEIDIPVIIEDDGIEEDPTEIYKPGSHPDPKIRAALAASSSVHAPVPPAATPTALAPPLGSVLPKPAPRPVMDDWEGETIVQRPEAVPPSEKAEKKELPKIRRPFNPDETMKLDNSGDFELLDTAVPRRS